LARIKREATITLQVEVVLDEGEARALVALAEFSDEDVLKALDRLSSLDFAPSSGSSGHVIREGGRHAAGLARFLQCVRDGVRPAINRVDKARELFNGKEGKK
jgi:hypothetical protein